MMTSVEQEANSDKLAVYLFGLSKGLNVAYNARRDKLSRDIFTSRSAGILVIGDPVKHRDIVQSCFPPDVLLPLSITMSEPNEHEEWVAYLGINGSDIRFLRQYYNIGEVKMSFLKQMKFRRKFKHLYNRTPAAPVDLSIELNCQPMPDGQSAVDPESFEAFKELDDETYIEVNTVFELIMGEGDRDRGRRYLNRMELRNNTIIRQPSGQCVMVGDVRRFLARR